MINTPRLQRKVPSSSASTLRSDSPIFISPFHQNQLEAVFLSALDVSAERFRLDTQFFGGYDANYLHAAVGDKCAIAVRFSADGSGSGDGIIDSDEQRDMLEMLSDLPDLWDINITDYSREMGSSRFVKEAALTDYVSFVKKITDKPVVTVGRFTSPDTMVSQVKNGLIDFIGAARPSIADPFLPDKIKTGRLDDIRECIGCNICYSADSRGVPIRCTQNPTMGEEWRRDWHPEKIAGKQSENRVSQIP